MKETFSYEQLIASGEGRLFAPGSGRLPLPPMLMFDRITHIDDDGGAQGGHVHCADPKTLYRGATKHTV